MISNFFNKKPEKLLYHYTSQQSLLGIIKTKKLWLTHVSFLNDLTEMSHALNLLKSKIQKITSLETQDTEKQIYGLFMGLLERITDNIPNFNVFAFSFSENGDLLSQWRGYCSNGGYSLGFEYEVFEKLLATGLSHPVEIELGKCLYEDSEHDQILTQILKTAVQSYKEWEEKEQAGVYHEPILKETVFASYFLLPLLKIAPFLKNSAFKEEQEWRMILTISDKSSVKFREGSKWIIPYYELGLSKDREPLRIKEIIIGPTIDQKQAFFSLKRFLESELVNFGEINQSKIPFRD